MSIARRILDEQLNALSDHMQGPALDIGGEKAHSISGLKRPDIEWKYLNNNPRYEPDYLAGADKIPVAEESFNTVLLLETLEHVEDPNTVLDEVDRVLKPGGQAFISMPFMYRHHRNPDDFRRWSHEKLFVEIERKRKLHIVYFQPRGGWIAVVLNDLSIGLTQFVPGSFRGATLLNWFGRRLAWCIDFGYRYWRRADDFLSDSQKTKSLFHRFTIGYLVVARKPGPGEVLPERPCPDILANPIDEFEIAETRNDHD